MNKTKLPRKKSIASLYTKASKRMQDFYRKIGGACSSCGKNMQVIHHHVTWGRSKYLRFEPRNFVRLCQGCHMQHHNGDPAISHAYRKRMESTYGPKWEEDLIFDSHTLVKSNNALRAELQEIIEKYSPHSQ